MYNQIYNLIDINITTIEEELKKMEEAGSAQADLSKIESAKKKKEDEDAAADGAEKKEEEKK
jgi:hypothetical protein